MKLAVVDIGSNAVRLQISNVIQGEEKTRFKKIEYLRFPLRLGKEVFSHQYISADCQDKLVKLFTAFRLLMELYEVNDHLICGTAALREADNSAELVARIRKETGLEINIIDGNEESALIQKAISPWLREGSYLHIEVGGGSTELSFYNQNKKIAAHSFNVGAVRMLNKTDLHTTWNDMHRWVLENKEKVDDYHYEGIATGGNIRKMLSLAKKKEEHALSLKKIRSIHEKLASYDYLSRQQVFDLNNDRADVILMAADIYANVMEWADLRRVTVPDVGLKDGMIKALYEKHQDEIE